MITYSAGIIPVPKPRMTRSDKWNKRKPTSNYWAYKDQVVSWFKREQIWMPESYYHLIFVMPMAKSWTKKRRKEMNGKPHQQKPDIDNLQKGFLDAVLKDDSKVWDGRCSKIWGYEGKIILNVEVN